jgi:hypothetical protein
VAFFDKVVGNSYLSFRSLELWDAWFRVWVVGLLVGTELNAKMYMNYVATGDKSVLDAKKTVTGVLGSDFQPFRELFDNAAAVMDGVRSGADPKEAANTIRAMFRGVNYVPTYFRWADSRVRTTPAFTIGGMTRMYFWYLLRSPRTVFDTLYGWKPWTAYRYILSSVLKNMGLARRRSRSYVRDVFLPWNNEWVKAKEPASDSSRAAKQETSRAVAAAGD